MPACWFLQKELSGLWSPALGRGTSSLHGTKAVQSSPSLLVSLAQPLLQLRRGGDVSLVPETGTAGTAMPRDEELGMEA